MIRLVLSWNVINTNICLCIQNSWLSWVLPFGMHIHWSKGKIKTLLHTIIEISSQLGEHPCKHNELSLNRKEHLVDVYKVIKTVSITKTVLKKSLFDRYITYHNIPTDSCSHTMHYSTCRHSHTFLHYMSQLK